MSGPYYSPDQFGLSIVKGHDTAGCYEFNQIVVWRRDEDGAYFVGHDSGCSCPVPFETTGMADLTRVHTLSDVAAFAREHWVEPWSWDDDTRAEKEGHVTALLDGLRLDEPGDVDPRWVTS